ncbi:broad specificity phosphatase PhoE [Kitasatospora sp. MAP12-15]|uniref:histidine phosphatase family protein n=1 Tax=unclassified Kitasatospora TaxID=2633591 RepID=UPI00247410CF|nr:phosphoglycerate mutase family protein [Kitasatospora sp. MAP12-44]MDH6109659.1 broad specificity phosphatase PhoE [Kitasatospora sp. MAP12-44]
MTLLIVRHAESVENADKYNGFYQDPRPYSGAVAHSISRSIVGLTPRGFRQAQWLAQVLPDLVGPEPHVYTSTYRRAIDTAVIALPCLPDGWPRQTPLLDEQHYGDATYMTKRELFDTYPELAEDRRLRKHFWTAPGGGESLAEDVRKRAVEFTALAQTELQSPCTIVAFTHQTAALALRSLLEDLTLPEILAEDRKGKMPNSAILHYELRDDRFAWTGTITPPI